MKIRTIDGRLSIQNAADTHRIRPFLGLRSWSCAGASGTFNAATETVTSCVRKDKNTGKSVNGTLTSNLTTQTWQASFPSPANPMDTFVVTVTSTATMVTSPPFTCAQMSMSLTPPDASPDLLVCYLKGSLITECHDSDDLLTTDDFVCTGAGGTYDPASEAVTGCRLVNLSTSEETAASQLRQDPATGQWEADFPDPIPPGDFGVIVQSTQRMNRVNASVETTLSAPASV